MLHFTCVFCWIYQNIYHVYATLLCTPCEWFFYYYSFRNIVKIVWQDLKFRIFHYSRNVFVVSLPSFESAFRRYIFHYIMCWSQLFHQLFHLLQTCTLATWLNNYTLISIPCFWYFIITSPFMILSRDLIQMKDWIILICNDLEKILHFSILKKYSRWRWALEFPFKKFMYGSKITKNQRLFYSKGLHIESRSCKQQK